MINSETTQHMNARHFSPNRVHPLLACLTAAALFATGASAANVLTNGGFETAAANNCLALNWNSGANTATESVWATNSYAGSVLPYEGSRLLFMEGTTPGSGRLRRPIAILTAIVFQLPAAARMRSASMRNTQSKWAGPTRSIGSNGSHRVVLSSRIAVGKALRPPEAHGLNSP